MLALKDFEESRLGKAVSFSEFLANPDLDVIYANEKTTHGAGTKDKTVGGDFFGKSYFAFIFDKATKQYCVLSYATNSTSESAYGITFESWWNQCMAVKTVYDIINLNHKYLKYNKLHNSRFFAQQTSLLLPLMRFKSIKRSIKYLYSILNKNKKLISYKNRISDAKPENRVDSIETVFYENYVGAIPVKWSDGKISNTYGAASATIGDNKVLLFHDNKNIGINDRNILIVVNELHFSRPIIRLKNKFMNFFNRKVNSASTKIDEQAIVKALEK